jgi:hypothetical protein
MDRELDYFFVELTRILDLTRVHSYLVLKCNESLAHQLLFAPDAIAYKLQHSGHFIPVSLLGTLVLMISVIALANAKIQLQIAWAVSYVILNIGHWMAAALPRCTYISLFIPMIGIIPFILARDVRTAICQSVSWTHLCCSHIILLLCFMHSQSSKIFYRHERPLKVTGGSTTTLTSGVSMRFRIVDGTSNSPMPVPNDNVEFGCQAHKDRTKSRAQRSSDLKVDSFYLNTH